MFGVSLQVDLRYIFTMSIYFLHFTSFYLDLLGILSDIIYGIPVGIFSDCLSHSLPDIFFDIGMLSDILSLMSDIFSDILTSHPIWRRIRAEILRISARRKLAI